MGQDSERKLSHLSPSGEAHMVDVSGKAATERLARASARLTATPEVLDRLMAGDLPKGEALATARIAGISAAKRTGEWIPLCHPLPLEWVDVSITREATDAILVLATAKTSARTGVEMEALVAAAATALTLYDMGKAVDKSMVIGPIQLEHKSGGMSGDYERTT